jgi:hypothetical protein
MSKSIKHTPLTDQELAELREYVSCWHGWSEPLLRQDRARRLLATLDASQARIVELESTAAHVTRLEAALRELSDSVSGLCGRPRIENAWRVAREALKDQ